MKRRLATAAAVWLGLSPTVRAELPPLAEVVPLLKAHLPGLTAEQLEAGDVESLLGRLSSRVRLLEDYEEPALETAPLTAGRLIEERYAYLRLSEVARTAFAQTLDQLTELRAGRAEVAGVVLDLRFAGGRDFAVAGQLAGIFLPAGTPLFDIGEGPLTSPTVTNRFDGPLAVLVNGQTHGAAEALATALQQHGAALLIGDATAGDAAVVQDLPLTTGQRLRVTLNQVKFADGQTVPLSGTVPDLRLPLVANAERAYLRDPFTVAISRTNSPTATNSITTTVRVRRRVNEAELVRNREGTNNVAPVPPEPAPATSIIRDPVLARGLDFLKGRALLAAQAE